MEIGINDDTIKKRRFSLPSLAQDSYADHCVSTNITCAAIPPSSEAVYPTARYIELPSIVPPACPHGTSASDVLGFIQEKRGPFMHSS